ncbi:hypothetical protein [uncultured Legionella sp.]|uniref:hypothetical protein n=1 Tax=uncultured Legionella sp. TaxID=210934 RepID=UPI002626ED86|nr:hypothetical protein [uncultured Legionella sp.]
MFALFKSHPLESITYIKMYSSLSPHEVSEVSFAFILMPYSHQKHLVNLQSIQFVFNARGEVTRMNILFYGDEPDILIKAKATMAEMIALKLTHKRQEGLSSYNAEGRNLEFSFVGLASAPDYLSDIIDCLKKPFLLHPDFIQEIKSQLLNQEYLAAEFIQLRGALPEQQPPCCIL